MKNKPISKSRVFRSRSSPTNTWHAGLALLGILFAAGLATAQTSPALLLKPWSDGKRFEASATAFSLIDAHTKDADRDLQLQIYEAQGRFRFNTNTPENPNASGAGAGAGAGGPVVGFDLTYLDFHTSDPDVPNRLVDHSFGFGMRLGQISDWDIDLIAGLGYAGNNPFADADAIYAKANLGFSRPLDEQSHLRLFLDYNGNRTIFPDVPLPGISYSLGLTPNCYLTVGAPVSWLHWQPAARWSVDVQYIFIHSFEARVGYELVNDLDVFLAAWSRYKAFKRDGDQDHRRLFFRQRAVEAGLQYRPVPAVQILAAAGYAFDQELERGFDSRDTHDLAEFSDEPYIRGSLNLEF